MSTKITINKNTLIQHIQDKAQRRNRVKNRRDLRNMVNAVNRLNLCLLKVPEELTEGS